MALVKCRASAGSVFCLAFGVATIVLNLYWVSFTTENPSANVSHCERGNGHDVSSPTDSSFPIVVNTTESPPRLFHCGGMAMNRNFRPVLLSVLPEYQWIDLASPNGIFDDSTSSKGTLDTHRESSPYDLFVSNWRLDECKTAQIYQWLHLYFQGRVVFLNPEDATLVHHLQIRDHFYELGPGVPRPNRKVFYFMQAAYWAQMKPSDKRDLLSNSRDAAMRLSLQDVEAKKFLIYAHSHCVGMRQTAFRQIGNMDGLADVVYFGGSCNGGMKEKAKKYPNKVRLRNWEDNRLIYQEFRFCLTMEHINAPGYITEKILLAYWAGCIPIYYGTTEIYNIFHPNSFIYYDVNNPNTALDRIKYLEQNRSAYLEVLRHPILADGTKTIEDYFSLDESIGRGILKGRIRAFLGVDKYRFK